MSRTRGETDLQRCFRRASLRFSTSMVNNFYFVDEDFGPRLLNFCSYFPLTARLCLNGHEYVKRQLLRRGIGFEALNNCLRSRADPAALQAICDEVAAERVEALLRKWLAQLPHPFTLADRHAGYLYQASIVQAGMSLTQVFDRPPAGVPVLLGDHPRERRPRAARVRAATVPAAHHPAHTWLTRHQQWAPHRAVLPSHLRTGPAPESVCGVCRRRAPSCACGPSAGSPGRANRSTLEGPMRRRPNSTQKSASSARSVG